MWPGITPAFVADYGPDVLDIVDQFLCSGAGVAVPGQVDSTEDAEGSGHRNSFLSQLRYQDPSEKGKENAEESEGEEDSSKTNGGEYVWRGSSSITRVVSSQSRQEEEEEVDEEEMMATQRNLQSQLMAQENRNKAASRTAEV